MAQKNSPKNVLSNEDNVKTGCILDKERFLCQHNHSDNAKMIIKAFEGSGLFYMLTFNYEKTYKKEVPKFYLNATIAGDWTIKSRVGDTKVIITAEGIKMEFNLPEEYDLDISSHCFNHKEFWNEIMSEGTLVYVKFSGKKKILLKLVCERAIDIIYKCLESKVTDVDEITLEKIIVLHVIISRYKCD